MSSNIRLQKVCRECGKEFLARTTVTRFCSHLCNSRYYKRQQRNNFLDDALMKERQERVLAIATPNVGRPQTRNPKYAANSHSTLADPLTRELLDVQELTVVIGMSERSIYRLLRDPIFPRLRIGKRILFEKDDVLNYLTTKYSNK